MRRRDGSYARANGAMAGAAWSPRAAAAVLLLALLTAASARPGVLGEDQLLAALLPTAAGYLTGNVETLRAAAAEVEVAAAAEAAAIKGAEQVKAAVSDTRASRRRLAQANLATLRGVQANSAQPALPPRCASEADQAVGHGRSRTPRHRMPC